MGADRRGLVAFVREARRRKVYTSAAAYIALSLILLQLGDAIFKALLFPPLAFRLLVIFLVLGFPVVLVLAWVFDLGAEGLQRTELGSGEAHGTAPPSPARGAGTGAARPAAAVAVGRAVPVPPPPRPRPEAVPDPEPAVPPDPERVRRAALAHVRHELRTPINAIVGYSEMLLDDAAEAGGGEAVPDLERIRAAGRELLALVDSILDPERVSADRERDIESYGAQIRANLRNPVNAVIGYAELLLEAGHEGLAPDLERIRTAARRLLELSTDIVQVATLGGGGGSAPEAVSAASAMTEGVLAKIRPLDSGVQEEERQGRLLVVDDNAFNRDLLSRQLARKGYLVVAAASGSEGLERLEADDFDLVLLDILMPDLDGVEVLRRIKARPRLSSIPVIMISSLDEIEGAIRCMELGAADYLTKPFHPTLLDARIGAVLELQRTRAREEAYRALAERGEEAARPLVLGSFPATIAERVRNGERRILESYAEATVLACDMERTARAGGRADPAERAARLDRLVVVLEAAAAAHGVDTVLLQGGTALLAGGIPAPVPDHAERVAAAALAAIDLWREGGGEAGTEPGFGLHAGPAVGGVVGGERLTYHLFGDAVEIARRLEARAEPGTVLTSPAGHALLKDRFAFVSRGVVEVAGSGQMRSYLLQGRTLQPAGR